MTKRQPTADARHATLMTPIRLYLESHLPENAYNGILKAFLFLNAPLQSMKTAAARIRKRLSPAVPDPLETATAAAVARYRLLDQKPASSPKSVSVIVPNYNYARFLPERLSSIARQTYPIQEIILLDDCSSDGSMEILERFAASSPVPVKIIRNEVNGGSVFRQWQKGVEAAQGDYIWIAEADDSAKPTFLAEAMHGFEDENVVLSYTESQIVDSGGKVLYPSAEVLVRPFPTEHWRRSYIAFGKQEAADYLSISNTILNVSAAVFCRSGLSDLLPRLSSFRLAGDWFFYLNLLKTGDIAYCARPLNRYRLHGSTVRRQTSPAVDYRETRQIHRFAMENFSLSPDTVLLQRRRRDRIKDVPPEIRAKRIAFLMSLPFRGSGGHRTLIQNINAAAAAGYDCDIYYSYFRGSKASVAEAEALTRDCCGPVSANIHIGTKQARGSI